MDTHYEYSINYKSSYYIWALIINGNSIVALFGYSIPVINRKCQPGLILKERLFKESNINSENIISLVERYTGLYCNIKINPPGRIEGLQYIEFPLWSWAYCDRNRAYIISFSIDSADYKGYDWWAMVLRSEFKEYSIYSNVNQNRIKYKERIL